MVKFCEQLKILMDHSPPLFLCFIFLVSLESNPCQFDSTLALFSGQYHEKKKNKNKSKNKTKIKIKKKQTKKADKEERVFGRKRVELCNVLRFFGSCDFSSYFTDLKTELQS